MPDEAGELHTLEEWHEDDGNVLWWRFPIEEPPYVGSPLDCGHTVEVHVGDAGRAVHRFQVGGWPGYHTHWTRIPQPASPESAGTR